MSKPSRHAVGRVATLFGALIVVFGLGVPLHDRTAGPILGEARATTLAQSERLVPGRSPGLVTALATVRWIGYAPTNFDPTVSPKILPGEASIRADLETLRCAGFDGLVTYGAEPTAVPRIAEELGFQALLLGLWDPTNNREKEDTIAAAARPAVLGIIVGNEGLMTRRYDLSALKQGIGELRRRTGKPVTTSEVVESYFVSRELIELSDFLVPNAHPYHHGIKDPGEAVQWTVTVFASLERRARAKPVLLKEVGLPSAGAGGLSEDAQAEYYARLANTNVRFVFFEAYDAKWKTWGAVEPHWGLFHVDRSPKLAIKKLQAWSAPGSRNSPLPRPPSKFSPRLRTDTLWCARGALKDARLFTSIAKSAEPGFSSSRPTARGPRHRCLTTRLGRY